MRAKDLQDFEVPYASPDERNFARAVGVDLPNVTALDDEILADLRPGEGIPWWAPLDLARRRLIADHLLQSVRSIEMNLVEANLHLREVRHAWEVDAEFISRAEVNLQSHAMLKLPARTRPLDDLHNRLIRMHIAGFFRALVTSLDCLGAAAVGVAGVARSIRKAALGGEGGLYAQLEKLSVTPTRGPRTRAQHVALRVLDAIKHAESKGPLGWLPWVNSFRNMTAHRPRGMVISTIVPNGVHELRRVS